MVKPETPRCRRQVRTPSYGVSLDPVGAVAAREESMEGSRRQEGSGSLGLEDRTQRDRGGRRVAESSGESGTGVQLRDYC